MTLSLVNIAAHRKAIASLPSAQAEAKLITLWLEGKASSSVRSYQRYTRRFLEFLSKPLKKVTYEDLVEYASSGQQEPYHSHQALAVGRANGI